MADINQRFIYSLLASNRGEQQEFYSRQVPLGIFALREREMLWIYKYRSQHGRYPSVRLFNTAFPKDPLRRNSDPLKATLQPILDLAMFNQMRDLTTKAKEVLDKSNDVRAAMALFKAGAQSLTEYSTDYVDVDFSRTSTPLREYRERMKQIAEGGKDLIKTPWPRMSKLIKYYSPGDVVAIAARMSIGKTWVITYWANYYALQGFRVLFITKEMSTVRISERFEAMRFRLNYDAMREGVLKPRELRRWAADRAKASKKPFEQYPLIISGDETLTGVGLSHVVTKIEQYKPQIVFIDGAYLLTPEGLSKSAGPVEKAAAISNRTKSIAKVTKTVIFNVLQMNRSAELKDTTKGSLASIYGSDAWAQDSDGVFDLSGQRGSNVRILDLMKGRDSAIGSININFRLDPYPDLSEANSVQGPTPTSNVIKFKGI